VLCIFSGTSLGVNVDRALVTPVQKLLVACAAKEGLQDLLRRCDRGEGWWICGGDGGLEGGGRVDGGARRDAGGGVGWGSRSPGLSIPASEVLSTLDALNLNIA